MFTGTSGLGWVGYRRCAVKPRKGWGQLRGDRVLVWSSDDSDERGADGEKVWRSDKVRMMGC